MGTYSIEDWVQSLNGALVPEFEIIRVAEKRNVRAWKIEECQVFPVGFNYLERLCIAAEP